MLNQTPTAEDKLESFFKRFRHFHYKKDETLLHAGDEPSGVFYLSKGFVRLYSISKDGEELSLIIFKPGDFFPMIWAINKTVVNYYLETMTPVELYRTSREEFRKFIKGEDGGDKNVDVLYEITSKIVVRLGGLLSRMEYLAFGNAYQKVASILHICAERFGESVDGSITIQVPLTHKDIASLVGVTRETASIEVKKLERKGLISFHGRHIVVKNLSNLRRESLLEE